MATNWDTYWRNKESAAVKESAAFNQALAYLNRIDTAIKACNEYAAIEDLDSWYLSLCVFYRELLPRMDRGEYEKVNPLVKIGRIFHINKIAGANVDKNRYYELLDSLDANLRVIMNAHGLLMPSKEDGAAATFIDAVEKMDKKVTTVQISDLEENKKRKQKKDKYDDDENVEGEPDI